MGVVKHYFGRITICLKTDCVLLGFIVVIHYKKQQICLIFLCAPTKNMNLVNVNQAFPCSLP